MPIKIELIKDRSGSGWSVKVFYLYPDNKETWRMTVVNRDLDICLSWIKDNADIFAATKL